MLPKEDTLLLAKAYFNLSNAAKYFDLLLGSRYVSFDAKQMIKQAKARCEWAVSDVYSILKNKFPDSAETFREQIKSFETLAFENIFSLMVDMSEHDRLDFERFAEHFAKGEIQVVEENVSS